MKELGIGEGELPWLCDSHGEICSAKISKFLNSGGGGGRSFLRKCILRRMPKNENSACMGVRQVPMNLTRAHVSCLFLIVIGFQSNKVHFRLFFLP